MSAPSPPPAQKIVRAGRTPLDPEWVERVFSEINLLVLEDDVAAKLARHVATSPVPGRRWSTWTRAVGHISADARFAP